MANVGSMAVWSGLVTGPVTWFRLKRVNSCALLERRWSTRMENWSVTVVTFDEVAKVRAPYGPSGIVGKRVSFEHGADRVGDWDGERVVHAGIVSVWEADSDNAVPLVGGGNREDLRGSEDLAKALILADEVGAVAAVI